MKDTTDSYPEGSLWLALKKASRPKSLEERQKTVAKLPGFYKPFLSKNVQKFVCLGDNFK